MRIKTDIIKPLETLKSKYREIKPEDMSEEEMSAESAIYEAIQVLKHINKYTEMHGEVALSCGGEWLYQDDEGQIGALNLVEDLLEELSEYAEIEDEDED